MNIKSFFAPIVLALALMVPGFAAADVDINSADAQTIAEGLNGIGLTKAEAIVAHRAANGPFESADDLAQVKGIGIKTVDRNRDVIVVGKAKPKSRAKAPVLADLGDDD